MIADIVNDPRFKLVFSFILGFGIASLFRPLCAGDGGSVQCRNFRAPDVKEMKEHIYRIGKKCYRFNPNTIECPAGGNVIEAFCTA